jgi:hypothetical protein
MPARRKVQMVPVLSNGVGREREKLSDATSGKKVGSELSFLLNENPWQ